MIQLHKLADVIRAKDWWVYKLGPILGTGYATSTILDVSLFTIWPALIFLLIALVLDAIFASIINDICDAEEDHLSGKTNYMFGKSSLFITSVLIATILPGLLLLLFLLHNSIILTIYVSNWLVFALYSIPPIRLKKRGFLGVLAIGLGESLLPHLFAILWIAENTDRSLPNIWGILIGIWSIVVGLRSILWHQLKDFDNDLLAGVKTFAVSKSSMTLQRLGKWIVFPAEVITLVGILFFFHNPLVWILLSIYLITEYLRLYFWKINIIIVNPSGNDRLFLFEYYDLFYPLGAILLAIEKSPINLIFLGVYTLFYSSRIWWWFRDIYSLLRWEIPKYFYQLQK